MANYKMINADQLDADMASLADTIRTKGGTTGQMEWPEGFKSAVAAIRTLPTLTNPGTYVDLASGKQLIDAEGKVITGTAQIAETAFLSLDNQSLDYYAVVDFMDTDGSYLSEYINKDSYRAIRMRKGYAIIRTYSSSLHPIAGSGCTLIQSSGQLYVFEIEDSSATIILN